MCSSDLSGDITLQASEDVTFSCRLDGASAQACTGTYRYASLSDGQHSLVVRATDRAGRESQPVTVGWTVDTKAPGSSFTSRPSTVSNNDRESIAFAADELATLACKLDDGAWAACASPFTTPVLLDGDHTLAVRSTDRAGNLGPEALVSWT